MSTKQDLLYRRKTAIRMDAQQNVIDALCRSVKDLERRLAEVEKNRDDAPEPKPELPNRKAARVPARPRIMKDAGVGKDPS